MNTTSMPLTMLPAADLAWRALLDRASAPYRPAGRYAWQFARGKLGLDPVFRHLVEADLVPAGARVLDLGCGQGLLGSLLQACGPVRYTGIELLARDAGRARAALVTSGATIVCADVRTQDFPVSDTVVLLDVLHYLPAAAQEAVLARACAALAPGGRLLLRVGDAEAHWGYAFSRWVDRVVSRLRRGAPPVQGRPVSAWTERLCALGLQVEARPMSQGTLFANVLLVAQRREGAAA
ncbi:class I SAM-dependent methyltransferase [Sphaerotilus sp.]|uniref:class I SAM-dependent methyltransferase n=1 Tax=Sphaerotilus sp. TaxID=2093942 RepID=UPI0034E19889